MKSLRLYGPGDLRLVDEAPPVPGVLPALHEPAQVLLAVDAGVVAAVEIEPLGDTAQRGVGHVMGGAPHAAIQRGTGEAKPFGGAQDRLHGLFIAGQKSMRRPLKWPLVEILGSFGLSCAPSQKAGCWGVAKR